MKTRAGRSNKSASLQEMGTSSSISSRVQSIGGIRPKMPLRMLGGLSLRSMKPSLRDSHILTATRMSSTWRAGSRSPNRYVNRSQCENAITQGRRHWLMQRTGRRLIDSGKSAPARACIKAPASRAPGRSEFAVSDQSCGRQRVHTETVGRSALMTAASRARVFPATALEKRRFAC